MRFLFKFKAGLASSLTGPFNNSLVRTSYGFDPDMPPHCNCQVIAYRRGPFASLHGHSGKGSSAGFGNFEQANRRGYLHKQVKGAKLKVHVAGEVGRGQ